MPDARSILDRLAKLSEQIVASVDMRATLQAIVDVLCESVSAGRCSIMLKSADDSLEIVAARGLSPEVVANTRVAIGEGIAGEIAMSGEARLLVDVGVDGDADESTPLRGHARGYASSSAICIPLRFQKDLLGVVNLSNKRTEDARQPLEFDEHDLSLASLLANQVSLALASAEAVEAVQEREALEWSVASLQDQIGNLEEDAAALAVISRVTDSIISEGTLDEVLERIVRSTTALLGAQRGSLMLVEPGTTLLTMRAAVGIPQDIVEIAATEIGCSIAGHCAETGEPLLIRDVHEIPGHCAGERQHEYASPSAVCVPLKVRGEILGVLNINDREDGRAFTESDLFVAQVIASQAAVAISNNYLLEASVSAAETRRAVDLAREIQQSFVPDELVTDSVWVAGCSLPCDGAGGDYVDFWKREDGQGRETGEIVLTIGDVSGHGVGSALIMATCRALLRALLSQSASLDEVMRRLNQMIVHDVRHGQFMTLFVGIFDPQSRVLTYASAGHDPPILYDASALTIEELPATGPPLGVVDETTYPVCRTHLSDEVVLALTTDGVWDVKDARGRSFGRERLAAALVQYAWEDPASVMGDIQRQVVAHAEGCGLADDFSMVVCKIGRPVA